MATRRTHTCTCEAILVNGNPCGKAAKDGTLCNHHAKSLERGTHMKNDFDLVVPATPPMLGEYVDPNVVLLESAIATSNWEEARA